MSWILTFPAKRKRFPRFKKTHATKEAAEREARRVQKLLPSWGEPPIHDHIRQSNPGTRRSKKLKNFTGTVTVSSKGVIIQGVQR